MTLHRDAPQTNVFLVLTAVIGNMLGVLNPSGFGRANSEL